MKDAGLVPTGIPALPSRRTFVALGLATAGGSLLAACTAPATAQSGPQPSAGRWGTLYLSVIPGGMLGKEDWSTYVPAYFTIPARATVDVAIANFDHWHEMPADLRDYLTVRGVTGNAVTVVPLDIIDPNAPETTARQVSAADPLEVSHTFTVQGFFGKGQDLNVPLTAQSRTIFEFKTADPGDFVWECMVPCAAPPSHAGGSMATYGYMKGKLIVAS